MSTRRARDEQQRFAKAFGVLALSKGAPHEPQKLAAALVVLGELPIESVEYATHTLAQEATRWMPDYGSIFEIADGHRADREVHAVEMAQRTAGGHLEDEEQAAIRDAREAFVHLYETMTAKKLSDDHVWKTEIIPVPAYHCLRCHDTGWRPHTCVADDQCPSCVTRGQRLYDHEYVDRCLCAGKNPVLVASRAHADRSDRRRRNTRGATR